MSTGLTLGGEPRVVLAAEERPQDVGEAPVDVVEQITRHAQLTQLTRGRIIDGTTVSAPRVASAGSSLNVSPTRNMPGPEENPLFPSSSNGNRGAEK